AAYGGSPGNDERGGSTPSVNALTEQGLTRNRGENVFQVFQLERLLQGRASAIGLGQAALAVAGGKRERHAAFLQQVGHRIHSIAVEVDVEDGQVEVRLARQRHGLVEAAGRGGDAVTEVGQHVLQEHANHDLVFHHEDAALSRSG